LDALTPVPLFSDIFGQDAALDWLAKAYRADRLPHGLVFAGPAGVGKATTARALGQVFLCERPVVGLPGTGSTGPRPCGACDSCRVFESGNHPDWHVVTKELIRFHDKTGKSKGIDLSIHVIRPELVEKAAHKPAMGRGKVFVVEQADTMNAPAQNALLKTLEEPAGRTLIVLVTDQPDALLPTIRSRCQTLRFAALDAKRSAAELVKRGVAPDVAARAAAYANGSLGTALKWVQDEVVPRADELTTTLGGLFAGRPPIDLPGWLKAAADAYAKKQVERDELGSEDQARREGIGLYLYLAGEACRRRMATLADRAAATDPSADGRTAGVDEAGLDQACAIVDALRLAETYLEANVNVALVFQQLAATLERVAVAR
jgi:DNA polymerase III delta' subunit